MCQNIKKTYGKDKAKRDFFVCFWRMQCKENQPSPSFLERPGTSSRKEHKKSRKNERRRKTRTRPLNVFETYPRNIFWNRFEKTWPDLFWICFDLLGVIVTCSVDYFWKKLCQNIKKIDLKRQKKSCGNCQKIEFWSIAFFVIFFRVRTTFESIGPAGIKKLIKTL